MSRWQAEPFRVFFPLAVVLGWAGVGHWLWYATGVAETYSCFAHGLVQMQAFMPALAAGFLLTALPRRTQSAPPSRAELGAIAGLLVACAVAALAERPLLAEGAYLALLAVLARFAGRRLLGWGAGRRPPAAFVLVLLALVNGAVGALCVGLGDGQVIALGRLLVEQGVFLCLVVGVGALILPIVGGMPPPPDLDGTARTRRALAGFAALGLAVDATFLAEVAGLARAAPLARAGLVAAGLAAAGAARRPAVPGFHRRLVWAGAWLTPAGLAAAALFPDYRVPALHVLFIGGFATLGFGVATHVSLGHLGLAEAARGRPAPVVALAAGLFLALLARVAADWSDGYFTHLGWAAAAWTAGTAAWLAALGPRLLRR